MILRLPYGTGTITADLRGLRCQTLDPRAPRGTDDVAGLAAHALDAPLAGPPLTTLAAGRARVAVLVPDATRKVGLSHILPMILARLHAAGVAPAAVTVLVACGTHPPVRIDELSVLVGELPPDVAVLQHNSRDESALVAVGTLPSGLRVRLNRAAVEADLVIAVSGVAHHYFAGFTGGPKLVFPGVAGYEEIQANHSRVIDLSVRPPRRQAGCEAGVLKGNPVAEEIIAAAALRTPDMALLLVKGSDGRPAWACAGPLVVAFPAACARVREWYEVEAGEFSKLVVSGGGHPADHTLIQAHKALDAACRYAKPGAEVLFVAPCEGGAGSPEMLPFLADPRPDAIVARLFEGYVQYGHTTLRIVEKTARYRVHMVTKLDHATVRGLGFDPVHDVQQVLDRWREEGAHDTVGVMAGAAVVPPTVRR